MTGPVRDTGRPRTPASPLTPRRPRGHPNPHPRRGDPGRQGEKRCCGRDRKRGSQGGGASRQRRSRECRRSPGVLGRGGGGVGREARTRCRPEGLRPDLGALCGCLSYSRLDAGTTSTDWRAPPQGISLTRKDDNTRLGPPALGLPCRESSPGARHQTPGAVPGRTAACPSCHPPTPRLRTGLGSGPRAESGATTEPWGWGRGKVRGGVWVWLRGGGGVRDG